VRKVTIITANGSVRVPSVLVTEIRIGSPYAHHVAVTCQRCSRNARGLRICRIELPVGDADGH